MVGRSKQLQGICPQDAAGCVQHTKHPACRYLTSVSGQGGCRRQSSCFRAVASSMLPLLGGRNVLSSPSGRKVQSPELRAPAYAQHLESHTQHPVNSTPLQGMTPCSLSLPLSSHQQQLLMRQECILLPGTPWEEWASD